MSAKGRLRALGLRVGRHLLRAVPHTVLERLIAGTIKLKAETMKPDEALRSLFRMDAAIYALEGRLAVAYGGGVHTKHRHMKYHDFFVERITDKDKVLDVGCGIGALAYSITEGTGATVVGVDISEANIESARRKHSHPHITYLVGDVLEGIPDGPFDVVVMSNVLEHLEHRVAFLAWLMNASGASRFLLRVPLFERDWRVPLKRELGIDYRLDATHFIEYTFDEFAKEIRSAGLSIANHEVRWGEIWAEANTLRSSGDRPVRRPCLQL